MKRQITKWERNFAGYMSERVLVSRMFLKNKKPSNPIMSYGIEEASQKKKYKWLINVFLKKIQHL